MGTSATPQQQAAEHVAELLNQARSLARDHGSAPTARTLPESTRHILSVIRRHRLYPDTSPDAPPATVSLTVESAHNYIAQTFNADPRRVTDAALVLAIADACYKIADRELDDDTRAELHTAAQAARAATRAKVTVKDPEPVPPPKWNTAFIIALAAVVAVATTTWLVSPDLFAGDKTDDKTVLDCLDGTKTGEIIQDPASIFRDEQAEMIQPTLDFDIMNGSARYLSHRGPKYYWGRAGSDDHDPHSGGIRLTWKTADGPWHECRNTLPKTERGYVRTPAVPTVIGGRSVTLRVCLWRDTPYTEKCTTDLT